MDKICLRRRPVKPDVNGYGHEKSYSKKALRQMLEHAGLEVVAETAILFMPGWLRIRTSTGLDRGADEGQDEDLHVTEERP